jgi:hypothetical protein
MADRITMNVLHRPKVVVLGMMTRMPVAGVVWQNVQYLIGLERLGFDVYYVEAHAMTPSMFMEAGSTEDPTAKAVAFIEKVFSPFGLSGRWAFHALHDDGRYHGMSESAVKDLYREAAVIINLHGGTVPLPEHTATGRLVYLETDPVAMEIELHDGLQNSIDFLRQHCAYFTWGENMRNPDSRVPVPRDFDFKPTRQPVVMDFWEGLSTAAGGALTTIGNWEQRWREVKFQGETYSWSKHFEFLKFVDLPQRRKAQQFELALASYDQKALDLLQSHGWNVVRALDFSMDVDQYRQYIVDSRGEFTVAKDQNVRLLSGWFSDRSATYLAAGRPVITQETGFSNILPTGEGLFAFSTMDEAMDAVDRLNSDYPRHRKAAVNIARECFSSEVVLGRMMKELGL